MTNDKLLTLTAKVVAQKLNIEVPEIRYVRNFESNTFGFVTEKIPNVVFIDMEQISTVVEGNETMMSYVAILTLIHEMRHLWQHKNNWNYEYHLPYAERKAELDADAYSKHYVNNVINEVYAILESA